MNSSSWGKLPIKQKISAFALVIIVVTYVFYEFVFVPQWAHIDDVRAQYNTERQKVKVIENFVLAHPNPEQYLIELDTKLLQIDRVLPEQPEMSSFLVELERLSQESGVQLSYLKPSKVENKEGYRQLDVEFSVKGNFNQIMTFLNKTEQGSRFINVSNITMQVGAEGLTSKLSAKIYTYGVPPAPATNAKTVDNKK